jgi:hypothetical protein
MVNTCLALHVLLLPPVITDRLMLPATTITSATRERTLPAELLHAHLAAPERLVSGPVLVCILHRIPRVFPHRIQSEAVWWGRITLWEPGRAS